VHFIIEAMARGFHQWTACTFWWSKMYLADSASCSSGLWTQQMSSTAACLLLSWP